MDPNLFHLDWARVAEVLVAMIVLSFLIERALALLFESKFFLYVVQGKTPPADTVVPEGQKPRPGVGFFPIKELIAFVVAAIVCLVWRFDSVSMIFLREQTTVLGALVTAGIVAGGCKASVKLFRDVMGIKSTARKLIEESE